MKKIMFNDKYGLTQAVLEGRKTQTRRIIKVGKEELSRFQEFYYNQTFYLLKDKELVKAYFYENPKRLPFRADEIVAIAQSYKDAHIDFIQCDFRPKHHHIWGHTCNMPGYNNKMFTQASVMPNKIRITNVRIERLQDISDGDCLKEGLEWDGVAHQYYVSYKKETGRKTFLGKTPREAFSHLIDKVSGKGTWESNPYVWVYDFELVK